VDVENPVLLAANRSVRTSSPYTLVPICRAETKKRNMLGRPNIPLNHNTHRRCFLKSAFSSAAAGLTKLLPLHFFCRRHGQPQHKRLSFSVFARGNRRNAVSVRFVNSGEHAGTSASELTTR
jgi:hypothetical protein